MDDVHPRVAAALRLQLEGWRAELGRGARRVGWKLAYDFPEIEAVIGEAPVLGHLTSATQLDPGGAYRPRAGEATRAETELAVLAGWDATVAGVAVALELVDVTRPPDDLEGIVAANAFHRAFALGEILPAERLPAERLREPPGDALAAAARLLAAAGEELRPATSCSPARSPTSPFPRATRPPPPCQGSARSAPR